MGPSGDSSRFAGARAEGGADELESDPEGDTLDRRVGNERENRKVMSVMPVDRVGCSGKRPSPAAIAALTPPLTRQ